MLLVLCFLFFETPDSYLTRRALYSGWQVPYPLGRQQAILETHLSLSRQIRLLWITHGRDKLDFGIWLLYMFPITCLFGSDYLRPPNRAPGRKEPPRLTAVIGPLSAKVHVRNIYCDINQNTRRPPMKLNSNGSILLSKPSTPTSSELSLSHGTQD